MLPPIALTLLFFDVATQHRKEKFMEYLKIKCHRCGNSFVLYNKDMNYSEKPPYCPHCLVRMNDKQWERLIDAYFTFSEVNKNFRKYHMDRGEPLFQAELCTEENYVDPTKICID